jgi:hypothetical protein
MGRRIENYQELKDHKYVMFFHESIDFIKCKVTKMGTVNPNTNEDGEPMYQLTGKWHSYKIRADIFNQEDFEQYIISTV